MHNFKKMYTFHNFELHIFLLGNLSLNIIHNLHIRFYSISLKNCKKKIRLTGIFVDLISVSKT